MLSLGRRLVNLLPVGQRTNAFTLSLLTAQAPTQTPASLVFSVILLAHGFIQQTSFFYSSYDKKCVSSSLSVLQLQRQPLLPRHFGDTQIANPNRLVRPFNSTARTSGVHRKRRLPRTLHELWDYRYIAPSSREKTLGIYREFESIDCDLV